MTIFIIVITCDCPQVSIQIFLVPNFLLAQLSELYYVEFPSWNRFFLVFFSVQLAFFLVFPSLLKDFYIISAFRSCHFLSPDLKFFNPRVFHKVTRGIGFGYNSIKPSKTLLIYLSSSDMKLE